MSENASHPDLIANRITRVEELVYELSVSEVMTKNPTTFDYDTSIRDALEVMRRLKVSGAPVVVDQILTGIITFEDVVKALRDGRADKNVSEYMTTEVFTVHDYDQVVEALKTFSKSQVGRLPVLDSNNNLVGMLTKGDVSNGLLSAMERDFDKAEKSKFKYSKLFHDKEIISDHTSLILRYKIKKNDSLHGGTASNQIKKALLRLGASTQIARKCGIAIYEAEMNLIIHTNNGGNIRIEVDSEKVSMQAYDDGPGIENIEKAMTPGWSTASQEVRTKGFGAGMGLTNIHNCVDEMVLRSSPDTGTNLFMTKYLDKETENGPGKDH